MSPMERKRGGWRRNNNDCYMMWRWEVWSGLSSGCTVTRGRGVSVVGVRPDHPSGRETPPRGAAPPLRRSLDAPRVGRGREASERAASVSSSVASRVRARARGGGGSAGGGRGYFCSRSDENASRISMPGGGGGWGEKVGIFRGRLFADATARAINLINLS